MVLESNDKQCYTADNVDRSGNVLTVRVDLEGNDKLHILSFS